MCHNVIIVVLRLFPGILVLSVEKEAVLMVLTTLFQ